MNPWIKASLVAALAVSTLFAGTLVQAKDRLVQKTELQLAKLELSLALSPEQKPAWADFKKSITARIENLQKEMENKRKAGKPKTALERLERAEEASKQRARVLADTRKTVETFYGKLGEAQKTVFDAEAGKLLRAYHAGPGGRRGEWKHHDHGDGHEPGQCPHQKG